MTNLNNIKENFKKGQLTKMKLVEMAQKLFAENGYQQTGVDSIADSLGLTSGVFYTHFKSKIELLKKALEYKINFSKDFLLTSKNQESASDWVKRILKVYLSKDHRDSLAKACPLTTMSQELIKLKISEQVALAEYTQEFADYLQQKLLTISHQNQDKARPLISLCVGAVQLSRLETDPIKSNQILNQAYHAALAMIQLK